MQLNLTRPLIFFDLETTGTNITNDRIVEISIIKLFPDGHRDEKSRRINPEMHIPEAASAIHKITDEDVKDMPTFKQVAKSLFEIFEDCDIAGFNSNKFDVPMLIEEFNRAGITFNTMGRKFIDVQTIYHKLEPRTLSAAYKFYCGKDLENAHSAASDTQATLDVLLAQIEKYDQLKNDVNSLADFSNFGRALDLSSRIILNDNDEPVFNFGKHKGKRVQDVLRAEPSFYDWMMQGDFPKNTKDVLTALKFKFFPPKKR